MKRFTFIMVVLIGFGFTYSSHFRKEYYAVFESNELSKMESLANSLDTKKDSKAYLGALKMKMAGFQKAPSQKLKTFKAGRILLEESITKNKTQVEWRFLRLAVQEHAPKIVKYNSELKEDAAFIAAHFSTTPVELQKIITNYAANSSILKLSEFK